MICQLIKESLDCQRFDNLLNICLLACNVLSWCFQVSVRLCVTCADSICLCSRGLVIFFCFLCAVSLAMLVVASHWASLLFNECEVMSWCVQVSVGLCDVCWLFLSVLTCLRCFSFVSTWHNFFIRTSDTIGIFKYIIQMRFLCASVVHLKPLFRVVWLSNSTSFSYTSHPLSRSEKKVIYCSLASD